MMSNDSTGYQAQLIKRKQMEIVKLKLAFHHIFDEMKFSKEVIEKAAETERISKELRERVRGRTQR